MNAKPIKLAGSKVKSKVKPKAKSKVKSKVKPKAKSKVKPKVKPNTNLTVNDILSITEFFLKKFSRKKYLTDPTIAIYANILGFNPNKLTNNTSTEYDTEKTTMINAFTTYPLIAKEMFKYCLTKISKVAFLEKFSPEQITYITSLHYTDTKLIACAGSGKTRSIIGRIKFMVEHGIATKETVYAITFSKHAATDFHKKIKDLFPDFENFCSLKNFSTIDSLAKSILCRVKSHKSENVEILSIALRNYLRTMPDSDKETIVKHKDIKHLFIDEAQDLNEVQYESAILLKEKFGVAIHLVGDPNQNIFQFRRSSSAYLMGFTGIAFELTLNFRSSQSIINFSEQIKPVQTTISKSATNKTGPPVTIFTKPSSDIHRLLIRFIKTYGKTKDISNIAIICPTRGIGAYNSVGLSVIFNLLNTHGIPFVQLYDESSSNNEKKKIIGHKKDSVNLLTYHGTKGLEFDVVFVMDFYQNLSNIQPSEEEHRQHQYLLYVATSRAINIMFICTYTNVHGGYLNHWLCNVDSTNYYCTGAPRIPKLGFRVEVPQQIMGITELLGELNDEQLNIIDDMISISESTGSYSRRIYKDYTYIDRGNDESLFGTFVEELFYLQYYLARGMVPRRFEMIELIVKSKFVVVNNDVDCAVLKLYIVKNKLTWAKYDEQKSYLPSNVKSLIEKYFSRDIELTDCIVCTNDFIKIIEHNVADIQATYDKYLDAKSYKYDYAAILMDIFYLIVVIYAYENNHYYYINNHGKEKHYLLDNGKELFDSINDYATFNYLASEIEIKIRVNYPKLNMIGEIDFIEKFPQYGIQNIVEIKCVKEISIRYYVQLLLYNFCYYYGKGVNVYVNNYKIINLLTGLEHYVKISIKPDDMFKLLAMLADLGGLKFRGLNLVYDLETTDMIRTSKINKLNKGGTMNRIPRIYKGENYPEIIEIAIKDYDTGMVILDTMVKPTKPIHPDVQKLTGIVPSMLIDKPNIDAIKKLMADLMKNFEIFNMLAHNGRRFDDKIILYDKLVDPSKVTFMDTMSIIPLHMSVELESKSLGHIYQTIFGEKFIGHRAMNDVDALIKIMKFLGVAI